MMRMRMRSKAQHELRPSQFREKVQLGRRALNTVVCGLFGTLNQNECFIIYRSKT